ncbi:ABC transporter permease [Actinokineospora bangkokensis]|uniref:ABC3 transporter permease C-terminal domain-containing protein n=1 Tax=Actinokineospora bangkokensis TaxID=1193682 RepID=A0A1Q9LJ49_9PSEU|nr:FtsX-like permease family protein [Actinokineospora bangkokensis]OLR92030.1 hypothetical protein BJP25_24260 [Actinokineospora bangkokensis]
MFWLSARALRTSPGSFAAALITLLFGATVVLACAGLLETGVLRAVPPQRLAQAAVVVSGDQDNPGEAQPLPERVRLPSSAVASLGVLPGVRAAVADRSFPVGLPGGGAVTGHGWASAALAPYALVSGTEPRGEGQVVLDERSARGAGPGDVLRLVVRGEAEEFTVTGIARADGVAETAVFVTDGAAAALSGHPDQVDAVALVSDRDPAELAEAATGVLGGVRAVALTGDDRGLAEFPGAQDSGSRLISMSAVFGGVAILVAVFVVGSILGLLVRGRAREVALLRAVGATPEQVFRMLLGETMVVAVIAAVLALVPGRLLGGWLLDRLAASGVVPPQVVFHQGWIPVVVAVGVTLAAAVGATSIAARSATRTRPTEALAESALPKSWLTPGRLVFALIALAGALGLAVVTAAVMTGGVAASTAGPSAMLWAAGLALLAPGLARVLLGVLGGPVRALTGPAGRLAVLTSRARRVRVAGAITPVMLASGLATALIYIQVSQTAVAEREFTSSFRADAVVTSTAGGLDPEVVREVAALPGVRAASALVTGEGYLVLPDPEDPDDEPDTAAFELRGVTAAAAGQVTAARLTAGSFDDLTGDSVVLPDTLAEEQGLTVGSGVRLRLGDGREVSATVVGIAAATPGFEAGYVPADLALAHSTTGLLPQVLVTGDVGALAGFAAATPGAAVADRDAVLAARTAANATGAWVNYLMVSVIIGYALISLVNTLIVATAERRREFALQRLIGATRGQVLRMVGVEAVLVAVPGLVLGTVVALAALAPFGIALDGSPLPSGPLWIYLVVLAGGAVLTAAATLLPALAVLRTPPLDAAG